MTVTKVGRRWVYFGDDLRFDRDTGAHDAGGYHSYYLAYESRELYEAKQAHSRAAEAIRSALREWGVQITGSVEDIEKAADLLGVRDVFEQHRERLEAKR